MLLFLYCSPFLSIWSGQIVHLEILLVCTHKVCTAGAYMWCKMLEGDFLCPLHTYTKYWVHVIWGYSDDNTDEQQGFAIISQWQTLTLYWTSGWSPQRNSRQWLTLSTYWPLNVSSSGPWVVNHFLTAWAIKSLGVQVDDIFRLAESWRESSPVMMH